MTPWRYLARLTAGKTASWCYLLWYIVTVCFHFDATPSIWINSLGIRPPTTELATALGACAAFLLLIFIFRRLSPA